MAYHKSGEAASQVEREPRGQVIMADTTFASNFYTQLQADNHGLYSPLTLPLTDYITANSAA